MNLQRHRYSDQYGTEIYDWYDYDAQEPTPQKILDAEVIRTSQYDVNRKIVRIEYPIMGEVFRLSGGVGASSFAEECGKKAWVRNNKYHHPEKGYSVEIVFMAPEAYIQRCVDLFNMNPRGNKFSYDSLVASRQNYDVMFFDQFKGKIFPPYIDYKNRGQEGLHRAIYADKKNIAEIPVIIIY